jgi:hypothetical protein
MQQLTPAAENTVNDLAERYRVSQDAVKTLLVAVMNGGGSMAQFYHPELGGSGQWMRGGMTMVGDMFNYGLQGTVANLCSELSNLLASQQVFLPPPPPPPSQQQSRNDYSGQVQYQGGRQSQFQGGNFGQFGGNDWWPAELGSPSSSGGQNDSKYAYFPQARRLAVQQAGRVTVYDTLDHQIGGVQQQQSGPGGTQSFTSQFGTFTVDSLPVVSGGGGAQAPFVPAPAPAPFQADSNFGTTQQDTQDDVFSKLERLGSLRDKGILSDDEFQKKKNELLSRL